MGAGREVVWSADAVAGSEQHPIPATASVDGCGWPAALEIPVGIDWRSGFYSVRLTSADGEADAFVVVRAARPAPILLVLSTTTYAAYNDWGGPSLYTGGTRVSFERPLGPGSSANPSPPSGRRRPCPTARRSRTSRGPSTQALPLERRRRLVDVGAPVRRVGGGIRLRDRPRRLPGPRAAPGGAGWPSAVPLGGPRRVLVLGDA